MRAKKVAMGSWNCRDVARFGRLSLRLIASLSLLVALPACEFAGKAVEVGGGKARSLVGSLEPTGVVQDTAERTELMKSLRALVDSVNAEALNQAITQTSQAVTHLSERIEAIRVEDLQTMTEELSAAAAAVRAQLDAARLGETSTSIRTLASTANDQLASLDTDSVNSAMDELRDAVSRLGQAVEHVRPDVSTALARIGELSDALEGVLRDVPANELAANVDETITLIRATASNLPETTTRIDAVLATIHVASRLVIGVLLMLAACLAVWGFRLLRPCIGKQ